MASCLAVASSCCCYCCCRVGCCCCCMPRLGSSVRSRPRMARASTCRSQGYGQIALEGTLTAPVHTETPRGHRVAAKVLPAVFLESCLAETSDFRVVFQGLAVSHPSHCTHCRDVCELTHFQICTPGRISGTVRIWVGLDDT